jgi:bacterioferritin-associated ferredoxin
VVVGTGTERQVADALRHNGADIEAISEAGSLREILGHNFVRGARVGRRTIACHSVVHAGPWLTNDNLTFQASASGALRLTRDALPPNVEVVGSAVIAGETLTMERGTNPAHVSVCACMDVSVQEIVHCLDNGETHVEEIKRSTACGMGPCQGFPCWEAMRAIVSNSTGTRIVDIPSFRPPRRAITVAQAAGLDGLLDLE